MHFYKCVFILKNIKNFCYKKGNERKKSNICNRGRKLFKLLNRRGDKKLKISNNI